MRIFFNISIAMCCTPGLALALEPSEPSTVCERFIGEAETQKCKERAAQDTIDWYAGSLCNLQKEDTAFWNCWETLKGKQINPQILAQCDDTHDLTDEQRQSCIQSSMSGRKPASEDLFQKIKIKKNRK